MEFVVITMAKIAVMLGVLLTVVAYTVWLERKVCAWMQDRVGPNRVGPFGLLQPLADGLKMMLKEDVLPRHITDKALYTLGPLMAMVPALVTAGAIPWGSQLPLFGRQIQCVVANLNAAVLVVFATSSFAVYGIVLAGWASNSKYPFLGGVRSSAQMISYEVCLALSVVPVFMQIGSLSLCHMVEYQTHHTWMIFMPWQWPSFLIFIISAFAETNRTPFDLPEAEQELVAGYNTEYSSMKFSMFFLGEYAAMFVMSAMMVTLFFGGWSLPFAPFNRPATTLWIGLAHVAIFLAKILVFLFLYIWIRWTIPRVRYDQLMALGWKIFIPLTIVNIVFVGIVLALWGGR